MKMKFKIYFSFDEQEHDDETRHKPNFVEVKTKTAKSGNSVSIIAKTFACFLLTFFIGHRRAHCTDLPCTTK